MPVTVRTYVRRLVVDQRENDPARLALAAYLLDHVTRWQDDLDRADGPLALGRFLDVGLDVHASVEASLRLGRIEEGVALTLAAGPFWVASGELRQGLTRTVADACGTSPASPSRPAACTRSPASWPTTSTTRGRRSSEFERAIAVAERLGDEATVATSRCYYGAVLLVNGEVERGAEMARLGAEAAARLAIYPLAAESLSVLAISHAVAGEFANEREMHVARLAVAREHGDVARTADALGDPGRDRPRRGGRRPARARSRRRRWPSPSRRCRWRRAWRWPCSPARTWSTR